MTTTLNNGARKSLASQIDRLDAILDGLSDNLNEAVALAVASSMKEIVAAAIQEGVHAALVEILSNPEVLKRLAAARGRSVPSPVPTLIRLGEKARACWDWLVNTGKAAWTRLAGTVETVRAKISPVASTALAKVQQARKEVVRRAKVGWMLLTVLAALAKRFRTQLLLAAGVGVLIGVVCYLGGREVAAVGCGLAGFAGSLASGAVNRLRRVLPFLASSGS